MSAHVAVKIALAALAVAAIAATGGAADAASRGVSVSIGRIEIDQPLAPGRSYELPVLSVINPGDEPSGYQVRVDYVEGDDLRRPPREWFGFSVTELTLDPTESRPVEIDLRIPPGAEPGAYQALLAAQLAPDGAGDAAHLGSGARVGAAAAARLTFTVAPASSFAAWIGQSLEWLDRAAPFPQAAAASLAVWLLIRGIRKRFAFSVARRQ